MRTPKRRAGVWGRCSDGALPQRGRPSLRRHQPGQGDGPRPRAPLARAAAGEAQGLRITDFADLAALHAGDPFGPLLEAVRRGRVVVLDTETTELPLVVDTYEMARRFVGGPDLTLQGLCERLGTSARPTHRAADDVGATLELLVRLLRDVERTAPAQREAVEGLRRAFLPLAEEVAELRREVGVTRPPALLDRVLERSGLLRYYSDEPRRLANLEELRRVFVERDDPAADPLASLGGILTFAALARNVDRLGPEDDRVRVLTVHQAKRLEFEVVVVAGLSDNEFPNYGSIKDGRELEKRRLLYVALTRARRHLILTGHACHEGKLRGPSPYLRLLAGHLLEEGSATLAG